MDTIRNTPLWIAARTLLHTRASDFFSRWDRARKTFDPGDIHDLRVSSRRLREGLSLFAPCYPAKRLTSMRKTVRGVTRLLGEMRNTDEALLFFTELATESDEAGRVFLATIIESFQKKRAVEQKRLKKGLKEFDADELRCYFLRTIEAPRIFTADSADADPFISLNEYAGLRMAERLASALSLVAGARNEENVLAQHMLRIAVKRFRYRMEILAPVFGEIYQDCHGLVRNYQEILGKIHDLDVFAAIVNHHGRELAAPGSILNAIAGKRRSFYREFSGLLDETPLEKIWKRLEAAL